MRVKQQSFVKCEYEGIAAEITQNMREKFVRVSGKWCHPDEGMGRVYLKNNNLLLDQ
jgi:hypothetical protein